MFYVALEKRLSTTFYEAEFISINNRKLYIGGGGGINIFP